MQPTDIRNPDVFHKVVDCQWACPAHTPVPEYIRLIAEGRYSDAVMYELKARDHRAEKGEEWSEGRLSAARVENGQMRAGANPRGMQGYAVGR